MKYLFQLQITLIRLKDIFGDHHPLTHNCNISFFFFRKNIYTLTLNYNYLKREST